MVVGGIRNDLVDNAGDRIGLINDARQHTKKADLDDLRIETRGSFHRRIHVFIEGFIPHFFHGYVAGVFAVEVELHFRITECQRFHRYTSVFFSPAIEQAQVDGHDPGLTTNHEIDLIKTRIIKTTHRAATTILTQPNPHVEKIQPLTRVEDLHQHRCHAALSLTQVAQCWQGVRDVENDDMVTFVLSLELVEPFPLGAAQVLPIPPATQCRPLVFVHVTDHRVVDHDHVQQLFS
ncbi:hypothetical protein D9M69_466820 [compost metagenome]